MTIDQLTLARRLEMAEAGLAEWWNERLFEDPLEPRTQYERFLYDCYAAKGEWAIMAVIGAARQEQMFNTLMAVTLKLGTIREQRSSLVLFAGALPLGSAAGITKWAWRPIAQPITDPMGALRGRRPVDTGIPRNARACDAELDRMAANNYQDIFRTLMDTARRSNVVVHVVDPSGMSIYDPDPRKAGSPDPWRRANNRLEPLRTLAANTGGEAILATNNVRELMARMADDLSAYYLLGYYSTNGTFDGKYREIEVRVLQPGVRVSARKGYLAPTEELVRAADAAREKPAPVVRAVPSDFDRLLAELDADRRNDVAVRALVQGDEVAVVAEATGAATGGRVPDGARISIRAMAGNLTLGTHTEVLAEMRRSVQARFPLPAAGDPGPVRVEVRVVTVDGPVTTRVEAAGRGALLDEPLLYRGAASPKAPFVPAAGRQFHRTERLRLEWRATSPIEVLQARLLGRNGVPLAIPVTVTEFERDGRPLRAADLALSPLGAGDYVIDVTAHRDGRMERRYFAFRLR
jgi:VWFA-related protein